MQKGSTSFFPLAAHTSYDLMADKLIFDALAMHDASQNPLRRPLLTFDPTVRSTRRSGSSCEPGLDKGSVCHTLSVSNTTVDRRFAPGWERRGPNLPYVHWVEYLVGEVTSNSPLQVFITNKEEMALRRRAWLPEWKEPLDGMTGASLSRLRIRMHFCFH